MSVSIIWVTWQSLQTSPPEWDKENPPSAALPVGGRAHSGPALAPQPKGPALVPAAIAPATSDPHPWGLGPALRAASALVFTSGPKPRLTQELLASLSVCRGLTEYAAPTASLGP